MRVIICGGRDLDDREFVYKVLNAIDEQYNITTVITGGAAGADFWAHSWATKRRKDVEVFPANWDVMGKAAGIIRNKQMLNQAHPDMVVAFQGGRGTENMIKISEKAGLPVIKVESGEDD